MTFATDDTESVSIDWSHVDRPNTYRPLTARHRCVNETQQHYNVQADSIEQAVICDIVNL